MKIFLYQSTQLSLSLSLSFDLQITNFISDIGGQLGLWIGISCLTATEFVELVLLVIARISRNILDRNDKKPPPDTRRRSTVRDELYLRRQSRNLNDHEISSDDSFGIEDYNPRLVNLEI